VFAPAAAGGRKPIEKVLDLGGDQQWIHASDFDFCRASESAINVAAARPSC
jgi:hypothetical protein